MESPSWRTWRPASTGVFSLVVVVLAAQAVAAGAAGLRPAILGLSILILDGLGVVAAIRAGRLGDSPPWQLISAGRLFSMASVVLLGLAATTGSTAWWWAGTISRLLMFALLTGGALLAPARRLGRRQQFAFAAETVTVLGAGFMVAWYFVINPAIEGRSADFHWISAIGYPIGDLLLLTGVAVVVLRGTISKLSSPLTLFVGGLTCYLVGDAIFSNAWADGEPAVTSPTASFLLVLASLLMTLAAMRYRPVPSAVLAARKPSSWGEHLPMYAIAIGGGLLLVVTVRENDMLPWGGLVIGLIVMAGAVAVRQMLSLRDSRDLSVSDMLTGLANRTGLDQAIARAGRRGDRTAMLLIDLDGFKLVNDAYGHAAGDEVLTVFARQLRSSVRASDVPARIGGDEFAVLLSDVTSPEQAVAVAERILAAVAANPVRLGDDVLPIRASIGAALGRPEDMMRRADVAMYQAKRAGTHGVVRHDPSMVDRRAEDAALSDDLMHALDRDELRVLFQPIVDLHTGRPVSAEALLRWQHPTRGIVSPVRFIPIAERSGIITEIGLWVLEQALTQLKAWQSDRPLYISVNLSPRQLQEPTIVPDILAVLDRTGMPPQSLVLEVTESAIVDEHTGIAALRALREHGIRVAIDDFGTGYSSLQYLTRLPVDILKIDRAFVGELNGTPAGSAITEAVIRLSQVLNLTTVAEGIETSEQADELLLLGCDTGQGYLYAKPLPGGELGELMTTDRQDA